MINFLHYATIFKAFDLYISRLIYMRIMIRFSFYLYDYFYKLVLAFYCFGNYRYGIMETLKD